MTSRNPIISVVFEILAFTGATLRMSKFTQVKFDRILVRHVLQVYVDAMFILVIDVRAFGCSSDPWETSLIENIASLTQQRNTPIHSPVIFDIFKSK